MIAVATESYLELISLTQILIVYFMMVTTDKESSHQYIRDLSFASLGHLVMFD